ncbi:hypothetical protein [Rhizobium lentis]|uniref:hypothetical protein n=1 Tax=Rhizobium lentis TaxID=1138194 RepID=UPI001C83E65F|nr:hypothetical protein [Rhizobium lentis]MBX5016810.1 hypothetical protein [Rhizobium lentis]
MVLEWPSKPGAGKQTEGQNDLVSVENSQGRAPEEAVTLLQDGRRISSEAMGQSIDMTFGREFQICVGTMRMEHFFYQLVVSDAAFDEKMARMVPDDVRFSRLPA